MVAVLSKLALGALCASASAYNVGMNIAPRTRAAASLVQMNAESAAVQDVSPVAAPDALAEVEASMEMNAAPVENERFMAISIQAMDKWAEKFPRLKEKLTDIRMSALIFPFKASPYLVEELIDWEMEGDIADDPFYRLVFPTMGMLSPEHRAILEGACAEEDPIKIKDAVEQIREDLNPHPAGQKALNAPKKEDLTGVQHKYSETVLFFPAAGQTCHAYCTYCFRWAQFIGDSDLRFAQKDAGSLFDYLAEHEEVSDILFTGGDPMFMKTRLIKQYFEPFKDPTFLPHVKNLRIGTRALTFWPQRFTTDDDAD
jgi:L-lysine 2,3-aminomutase